MVSRLEEAFPNLTAGNYRITSEPDRDYNCIAWAAGDNRKCWWPGPDPERDVRQAAPHDFVRGRILL